MIINEKEIINNNQDTPGGMDAILNWPIPFMPGVELSEFLIGVVAVIIVIYVSMCLIFSVGKMFKKMKKKCREIIAMIPYIFKLSDDGKRLNFVIHNEVAVEDLVDAQKALDLQISLTLDNETMMEFNRITEPYRQERPFYKFFKRMTVDNQNLIVFANEIRNELRSITRQQFERMTDDEKANVSLKFAMWAACTDVIKVTSEHANDIRKLRKNNKEVEYNLTKYVLAKNADAPVKKEWLKELTTKLITEEFTLLTSFLLLSYFQAKGIIKLTETQKGLYIHLPVQFDKPMILVILLPKGVLINSEFAVQKKELSKIIANYQLGYKIRNVLDFVVKKGIIKIVGKLIK